MYGPGTLDQAMHRRSVYFFIKRSQLIPMMMLFDWPEHLTSIGQRSTTTIAPQALLLLNSPQGRQYAQGLAHRLAGQPPTRAIEQGYRITVGRPPDAVEIGLAMDFLTRQSALHRSSGEDKPDEHALVDFCQAMLSRNEFIYVD
jgi:hypothetical protein